MSESDHLPAPAAFDRAEVSAILRRAVEVASTDPGHEVDRLSAADLAGVAREVGLPPAALATALAESRAGVERRSGRWERLVARLVGPSRVTANSPITGDEEDAVDTLRRWLEVENGLDVYLRRDGVMIGSRRGGVAGALGYSMRRIQGTGGLDRTRSVRAATAAVDEAGAVCIVADVTNKRNEAVAGGSVVAGGSMAVVGIVAALAGPAALAGLPVAAALGLGTARLAHRRTVHQVARQVEQTTHATARDEHPVHPVQRLLRGRIPARRPLSSR